MSPGGRGQCTWPVTAVPSLWRSLNVWHVSSLVSSSFLPTAQPPSVRGEFPAVRDQAGAYAGPAQGSWLFPGGLEMGEEGKFLVDVHFR